MESSAPSSLLALRPASRVKVLREMSEEDIKLQAQEFIYRQTLVKEKSKAGRHALEEVGRSLNAIAQRRRQYFLEYKNCNSIRCVRQWYAWETKRNLETNPSEARTENAATRGIRMFLHRIDFYGTLLARFIEYILRPLQTQFSTTNGANPDLEAIKAEMRQLKKTCEALLSDNTEVILDNVNHIEAEKRFPVISILPRVHDTLHRMVQLSFQWRMHACYEQQFEAIENRRSLTETERDLMEKRKILRGMEHNIRRSRRSQELLEEEVANREQAISSSNFSQVYVECTDQIEAVRQAYEQCKANLDNAETTIKTVQQGFGKYKIVGQRQKKKLESSMLRRTRKAEELEKIKAELDRLESRKLRLDEEEIFWLRGGYENEVNIIESLREQSRALQKNVIALERQRDDLKASYENSMQQVFRLGTDYDDLMHKYEYVKQLAAVVVKTLWYSSSPTILVKPNKMDVDSLREQGAYDMTQPKGVALLIHNQWKKAGRDRPHLAIGGGKKSGPSERKNDLGRQLETLLVQLGFYAIRRSNVSSSGIRNNVSGLSDQYHGYSGNHNSIAVVVVANSNEHGQIIDSDGSVVSVGALLNHFAGSRCPTLIGKPKLFIFLLKVTVRQPSLPMVSDIRGAKKSTRLSLGSDLPVYFEPEPLTLDDDFIVARVMHEEDSLSDGGPTFGGVSSSSADGEIPWFAKALMTSLADQAGVADVAEILASVKRKFRAHYATPRSDRSEQSRLSKDSNHSPLESTLLRPSPRDDHVNMFVDSSLKRKLYLMPGI